MAFQYSVAVRNAGLDTRESVVGASPKLRIFSGAEPVNCAAADPVGKLVEMTLPADWMNDAAGGAKTLKGLWSDVGLDVGVALSFRIYDAAFAACHHQGTVTITGGGGDMTVDNPNIAIGQSVTVTGYTLTAGNA